MNENRYRRQFIVTPEPCGLFADWQHVGVGDHHVYAHPELELAVHHDAQRDEDLVLLGFAIDPRVISDTNADILATLAKARTSEADWLDEFNELSGRFVLMIATDHDTEFYSDPSGLRTMIYTDAGAPFYAASDSKILAEAWPLADDDRVHEYVNSAHFFASEENWLPSSCTLRQGVKKLSANHFVSTSSRTQSRFWPTAPLELTRESKPVADYVGEVLKSSIEAANRRYNLALPLTAGMDSRSLLAAARDIVDDVFIYTLRYRSLTAASADIAVPRRLLASLGRSHLVIDCTKHPDHAWEQAYRSHSTLAHYLDAGLIAHGFSADIPPKHVVLNGTVAETGRDFFYREGKPPRLESADDVLALVNGWKDLSFVREAIQEWFDETAPVASKLGYELSSLFYWEHRSAGWQAQSQLEWDLIFESFTPYNNRALLIAMLSVPAEEKLTPEYPFLYEIVRRLWPEVLSEPVNPVTLGDSVRTFFWRARRKLLRRRQWKRRRRMLISDLTNGNRPG